MFNRTPKADFFLIFCKTLPALSSIRHDWDSAEKLADKLSQENEGHTFFVMIPARAAIHIAETKSEKNEGK
jgi:hypothetical protein